MTEHHWRLNKLIFPLFSIMKQVIVWICLSWTPGHLINSGEWGLFAARIQLSSISGWHANVGESTAETQGSYVRSSLTVSRLCLPWSAQKKDNCKGEYALLISWQRKLCVSFLRGRCTLCKMPSHTFMLTVEWEDQCHSKNCPHLPVSIALRLEAGEDQMALHKFQNPTRTQKQKLALSNDISFIQSVHQGEEVVTVWLPVSQRRLQESPCPEITPLKTTTCCSTSFVRIKQMRYKVLFSDLGRYASCPPLI